MLRKATVVSLSLASMTAIATAQPAAPAGGDPAAGAPADPNAVPGDPAAAPMPADPNGAMAMQPPPPAAPPQGATLRNGFSLTVGQEFGTDAGNREYTGQLYGIDWRIGMQLNKAIGVYLNSHLSFGQVSEAGGAKGATGNFATAVTGEYTLPMRLFFAGGAGYGVLNNPAGPLVGFRVGYYPFEHTDPGKARRLNVALDYRLYFTDYGGGLTMNHVAFSIGYDRF